MSLMMTSLRAYFLDNQRYLMMVKGLDLMKASNWDDLEVK